MLAAGNFCTYFIERSITHVFLMLLLVTLSIKFMWLFDMACVSITKPHKFKLVTHFFGNIMNDRYLKSSRVFQGVSTPVPHLGPVPHSFCIYVFFYPIVYSLFCSLTSDANFDMQYTGLHLVSEICCPT